ncbi:MAG: sigma-70 family RNA polymerase sigma factor [Proteobacteria bacterium]|nr:sigma-70 family RNA polymerase sigma factor [Pseudomonadota bacterium]
MTTLDERFKSEALSQADALLSHALRLTHNDKDAEDLVQDTLIKAYRNFDKFEEGTNCKAWLFRIMTNEYISQYRHSQRERACVDPHEELDDNQPDKSDVYYPDNEFCEDSPDFSDEVSFALKHVPDDFKAIVIMADLQDQSYKEISDNLSIPIGTVMSRLFRGRQILRKKLHDYAASLGIVRA